MKRLIMALAATASIYAAPASAADVTQVYNAPTGLAGNQDFGGTLGLMFTVNQATTVTQIGVFDSGSDGLNATIFATIFDSTHTALFAPVTFAAGTGTSGSAYIFQPLTYTLAPGTYQLAAWGYNGAEKNYNYGFIAPGNGGPITFDSAGGRLTATGTQYTYAPGDYADNVDDGTTRYGAASLVVAVPEPATWAMMIAGFGMVGFGLRSRKRQTVKVTYA